MAQYSIESTHLLDYSSSCIDLIFALHKNLVNNSGEYSFSHPNCQHQIFFCKFSLKIYYSPPYERVAWEYQKDNKDLIAKVIETLACLKFLLKYNIC